MRVYSLSPLRQIAIELGLIERGTRDTASLPVEAYQAICAQLMDRSCRQGTQGQRRFSHEGARQVARALLTSTPLQAISFICVSDHVGSTRWKAQQGKYQLTTAEQEMFERADALRQVCAQYGVALQWRLMLADAWGTELFNDRVEPGSLDAYCAMMATECEQRGWEWLRWTNFMDANRQCFEKAMAAADAMITTSMVRWEAGIGEIAHDKIRDLATATTTARNHIKMRAAEGVVIVEVFGPMLVLSTESRSLQRYDNLLVSQADYPGHDYMPKYPHQVR